MSTSLPRAVVLVTEGDSSPPVLRHFRAIKARISSEADLQQSLSILEARYEAGKGGLLWWSPKQDGKRAQGVACNGGVVSFYLVGENVAMQKVVVRSAHELPRIDSAIVSVFKVRDRTGDVEACLCAHAIVGGAERFPRLFLARVPTAKAGYRATMFNVGDAVVVTCPDPGVPGMAPGTWGHVTGILPWGRCAVDVFGSSDGACTVLEGCLAHLRPIPSCAHSPDKP